MALRRRRRLRTAVVQAVGVLAAAGLGLLVPGLSVGATVESPRVIELLVAVGASFVPVIAIIYSLLFLVLQFRSAAFTPRLNLFRDSPIVWRAFSFFTGVMVFCFATAFAIGKAPRTTLLVPIIVVVLVLVAIAVFCALQASAFRSIQLASTWWRSRAAAARSSTTPTPINDGGSGGVRPAVRGRRRGAVAGARRDATGHRLPLRRTRGRHHRALRAAGAGDPRGRSHRARPRRSGGSRARAAQATTTT